ncbi:MAG: choice-of-anchor D domain-containing protein [Bacteroidota bacterium]|nr:choice-of-anchor D domain-containing protein [Bacteroidota bacterium]
MRIFKRISLSLPAILLFFIIEASVTFAVPVKHVIQFGGSLGHNYSPQSLDVIVGDTVVWIGDFTTYDLVSIDVPAGALPFGPIKTGSSFSYVVQVPGDYTYKNQVYFSLGMTGSIHAAAIHNGLSNEGREFYLAMIFPNYNTGLSPFFFTYAMINTYYDNEISISYFDELGRELPPKIYRVRAKGALKIPLNRDAMKIDETLDMPQNKSCHITSKKPITVEYLSVGPCSGGSYLALPLISLGKKYVAASYNDNPGDGAISNPNYSGGAFIVIGAVDGTTVQITPATTTTTGHTGAIHGTGSAHSPVPYTISLNKGQTYLVKSSGDDNENDMSGSIIEATNPIGVISGHENSSLGGIDPPFVIEGRDYMVEQMVPYELWDTKGYISVPLAEATGPADIGHGDAYRIYTFDDTTLAHVHFGVGAGGDDYYVNRFAFAEKTDVTGPTETYSTNDKKISVMQYDERSESKSKPWPAPAMMTVVPRSHWKKFYSFNLIDNGNIWQVIDLPYLNILSDHLDDIKISINGAAQTSLSTLTKVLSYTNLSADDGSLSATQYKLNVPPLSPPTPYYLTSEYPFMVYFYEMRDAAATGLGTNNAPNVPHEYAAPAGMLMNTGAEPTLTMTIDSSSKCSSWHICVRDTSRTDPGIKAIMLVDDSDGIYFSPGAKLLNAGLDTTVPGYIMGEYHPQVGTGQDFCFDVNVADPLFAANAPLAIVDNRGNAIYKQLTYKAPTLGLSTDPPSQGRADSIVFPIKSIGQQICTTFVFTNTAPVGGNPIRITSVSLKNNSNAFSVGSVTPPLPHTVAPQASDSISVCYTPTDTLRHRDSLLVQTGCFGFSISLDAHGATGLILAEDADFGYVAVGKENCKEIQVRNVGTAPLKILSLKLSDTVNFYISVLTLAQLPITIPKGGVTTVKVCFHPKTEGPYSESLTFGTDLGGSFATSIKNFSYLSGTGALISSVAYNEQPLADVLKIYPNPASGYSVIATLPAPLARKSTLRISDVLGREVYAREMISGISQIEIPIVGLPAGIYYLSLSSEDGVMMQKMEVVR